CQVMPFCDQNRLVIVQDYINKKSEAEKKIFINYLKKPNLTTTIVFFSTAQNDFFSSLEPYGTKIECDKLSNDGLVLLARNMAEKLKLKFSHSAFKRLLDYCNYSVTKVITEINKFQSIKLAGDIIEEIDVENNVTKDIEYVIFDLTQAISQKQNDKAFMLIDAMLKNKEQPSSIVATISNHFRRLFFVARSEFSVQELATLLNIKEYAVSKYRQQASFFSQKSLKQIFDKCVEVEYLIKSGGMDAKNSLNYLLAYILN
ncbi:MAG: DNA polymerase III subunit delta, partial [Clostridia bacterium]|nr:DNA polymerase III subunit delta [Clostridia bacterium]